MSSPSGLDAARSLHDRSIHQDEPAPAAPTALDGLVPVVEAIEGGLGLPSAARAAARALGAGLAVSDASGAFVAMASGSPAEEKRLLDGRDAVDHPLVVAGRTVGRLRVRPRRAAPPPEMVRLVAALLAQEVGRTETPQRVNREAAAALLADILTSRPRDRQEVVTRFSELGLDLSGGAGAIVVRVHPHGPETGDWKRRALSVIERGIRSAAPGSLAAPFEGNVYVLLPGEDAEVHERAADAVLRELDTGLEGFEVVVGRSRGTSDPLDLQRVAKEAQLAANVAESRRQRLLAFESLGAYRLMLPAMIDDPSELRRFYTETVASVVAYDEQYETDLVTTLETFLRNDGHSEATARELHTHRHTVRYRLERVKELSGLDVSSSEGREKLSLGLKSMRVLGIQLPTGPALEPGAEGGRIHRRDEPRD